MFAYKLPDTQPAILSTAGGIFTQCTTSTIRSNNWLNTNPDRQSQMELVTLYEVARFRSPEYSLNLNVGNNNYNPFAVLLRDYNVNSGIGASIINAPKHIPKEDISEVRAIIEHNLRLCPTDLYTLVALQKYRKQLRITLKGLFQLTNMYWKIVRIGESEWVLPKYTDIFNPLELVSYVLNMDRSLLERVRIEPPPVEILPYSTRAETYFKVKTNTNAPLIGIELELEPTTGKSRDQAFYYTQNILSKHCIIKSDGSVVSGFEVVSKPALWTDQLKAWSPWFDKLHEFMIARSNCGMHIHMNRRSLSFLQLAKLVEFINREENAQYIEHIAGRKPNNFCLLKKEDNITAVGRSLNNNIEQYGTRHVGLNLTNEKTIEFRMFAATTDLDVFQKNIEFVVALREYFTPGNSTLHPKEQTHFGKFLEWVRQPSNKKMYSKLHQHNHAFNPA